MKGTSLLAAIVMVLMASGARADSTGVRLEKIRLSGTLEGQIRYMRHASLSRMDSGAASDLYLRMVEIGIETGFSNWATAIAVLNSEWIGDYLNAGDERLAVDEVHLDLGGNGMPFYLVFGKRTQPFGVFENHLVSDPMTQDAYETNKVGAAAGVGGAFETDVSITAYKGDEMSSHFFQSGLFDTTNVRRESGEGHNVGSIIVSASTTPVSGVLTIFGALVSEPGRHNRNNVVNGGMSCRFPFHRNLSFDGEFMGAISREEYLGSDREFLERVGAATLSYSFVLKKSAVTSRGLYRARRAFRKSHPVDVAVRYEHYGDDGLGKAFGVWSVAHRWVAGGRYAMFENGPVSAYAGFEYRATAYRLSSAAANGMNDSNRELYFSLGLDF